MMLTMEAYLRRGKRELRRLALDPRVQQGFQISGWLLGGLLLSAARLGEYAIPAAMGAIAAATGWRALVMALGAAAGSCLFFGRSGLQGMLWAAMGLLLAFLPRQKRESDRFSVLLPAGAALAASAVGVLFPDAPLRIFLLRIAAAALSAALARQVLVRRDALTDWVAGGFLTLAVAQVQILPGMGLGYLAAGAMAVSAPFPGAALAGLGLDLAALTALPMGVVVCAAWFVRLIPFREKWMRALAPGAAYLLVCTIWGTWDWGPLPGLVAGGGIGYLLPPRTAVYHRRGEVGMAQVRLEMAAGIFSSAQQLLLETPPLPIDREAVLEKSLQRACVSCSARASCREREHLTALEDPLEFQCRKTGRVLAELRRGQEQLRSLQAQRQQQREYRIALVQQYQFLGEMLQRLSDQLGQRGEWSKVRYRIQVSARGSSRQRTNGDRCIAFQGTGCRYYIALCDGMGTGLGAAQEGDTGAELLRQLLLAGFSPEQAFQSINSLLILRGRSGAVTLDLAEIRLDTGRAALYKWGAAPSHILRRSGPEQLGKTGPPPGISLGDSRESVLRVDLWRGETLILASDGADVAGALTQIPNAMDLHPPDLASRLAQLCASSEDDATVAVVKLSPLPGERAAQRAGCGD